MRRLLESGGLRGTQGTTTRALQSYVPAGTVDLIVGRDVSYGGDYYVLQWDPADYLDGQEFYARLPVPELTGGNDVWVYLEEVNWEVMQGVGAPVVTDGTMVEWQDTENSVEVTRLLARPGTVYTMRFDQVGPVGLPRLIVLSPHTAAQSYSYLGLPAPVTWHDGLVHPLTLNLASNVTKESWAAGQGYLYAYRVAVADDPLLPVGTALPAAISLRAQDILAVMESATPVTLQGINYKMHFGAADVFTVSCTGSGANTIIDPWMAWDSSDGTARTGKLLIPSTLSAGDLHNQILVPVPAGGGSFYYRPVYKTGGTVLWTTAELYALKDQDVTLKHVTDKIIMYPEPAYPPGSTGDEFALADGAALSAPWVTSLKYPTQGALATVKQGAVSFASLYYDPTPPYTHQAGNTNKYRTGIRPDGPTGDKFIEAAITAVEATPVPTTPDKGSVMIDLDVSADHNSYYEAYYITGIGGAASTDKPTLILAANAPGYSELGSCLWLGKPDKTFVMRLEHAAAGSTRLYIDGQLMLAANHTAVPQTSGVGINGFLYFFERLGDGMKWVRWGNATVPPTTSGYVNVPAGAGNWALYTKAASTSMNTPDYFVKVQFNSLGGVDRTLMAYPDTELTCWPTTG